MSAVCARVFAVHVLLRTTTVDVSATKIPTSLLRQVFPSAVPPAESKNAIPTVPLPLQVLSSTEEADSSSQRMPKPSFSLHVLSWMRAVLVPET